MNAQLYQVFRTYWQRRILVLLALLAFLLGVGLFLVGRFTGKTANQIAPTISYTGEYVFLYSKDWKAELKGRHPSSFHGIYVSDPRDAPEIDLSQFSNISRLQFRTSTLTPERLAQITSLDHLRELELHADAIPNGTWTALGSRLTLLDVPARLLMEHAGEMPQMTTLEVLRINRDSLDVATMEVVAQIPNLRTLVLSSSVIDFNSTAKSKPAPPMTWDPAPLAPLKESVHLRSIFIDTPEPTARTTPELPGVVLYPAKTSLGQQSVLMFCIYFSAIVSIIVALQIWAHFATQHSVIIPGYHRPHQLAAVLVTLAGIFATMLLLMNAGIAILPALAIALAVPTMILVLLVGSLAKSALIRGICTPLGIISGVLIWFPAIGMNSSPTIGGEMAWFLQGTTWLLALSLGVGQVLLLAVSFDYMPKMTRQIYETSAMHPGFSPWDPQQQKRAAFGNKRWWQSLWDRSAAYPRLAGSSLWQQARLWQLGNVYRPLVMLILFGGAFLGMSYLMGNGGIKDSIQMGLVFQMGAIALFMPLSVWYRRCRNLQIESMRPVGRREFAKQLFVALARDQMWAIIPVLLGIAYLLFISPDQFDRAPVVAPLPLIAMVWGYALSTSIFVIRQTWILVLYFIAMIFGPVIIMGGLAFYLDSYGLSNSVQLIIVYAEFAVAIVLAVAIIRITYAKAVQREWGY